MNSVVACCLLAGPANWLVCHGVCCLFVAPQSEVYSDDVRKRLAQLEGKLKHQVAVHEQLLQQLDSVRNDLQMQLVDKRKWACSCP